MPSIDTAILFSLVRVLELRQLKPQSLRVGCQLVEALVGDTKFPDVLLGMLHSESSLMDSFGIQIG